MSRRRWRKSMQLTTACGCHRSDNQIHSSQLKYSLLGSFCASLNMRDIYLVHVINNFQAKVLCMARGRVVQTPHRCPDYAAKRKLVMMSPWCICLQQVKDSPMRSVKKARMTMFNLSNTRTTSTFVSLTIMSGIASLSPGSTASSSMFLQGVSKPFFKSRVLFLAGGVVFRTTSSATPNFLAAAINMCKL